MAFKGIGFRGPHVGERQDHIRLALLGAETADNGAGPATDQTAEQAGRAATARIGIGAADFRHQYEIGGLDLTLADIRALLQAEITTDFTFARRRIHAGATIDQRKTAGFLDDDLQQLLRRGQAVIGPARRIIAIDDRDGAELGLTVRQLAHHVVLGLLGLAGLGLGENRLSNGQAEKSGKGDAGGRRLADGSGGHRKAPQWSAIKAKG